MSTSSDAAKAVPQTIPYTYVASRLALVIPTLLLLVFIMGGFAGWGPGHNLVDLTHRSLHWVDSVTELHWQ